MNSTFFFTDFNTQANEYAQLKALKSCGFIGLYGDASWLAAAELNSDNAAIWQTLTRHREVYVCPSAARRRGINVEQPPRAGLRWLSLASMLEQIAPRDGAPWTISICLASDTDLARTEALELCLAALALDFTVRLSLRGAGILGLQKSLARAGAKAYASLAMFGLPHALIAAAEISKYELASDALSLPWRVGTPTQMPLMFEF